jgi:hypothetical protein
MRRKRYTSSMCPRLIDLIPTTRTVNGTVVPWQYAQHDGSRNWLVRARFRETTARSRRRARLTLPVTTQLYDRPEDRVTLDEVVKVNIRG